MNKTPNQVLKEYFDGKFYQGREYTPPEERKEREQKMINRKIDSVEVGMSQGCEDSGMDIYCTDEEGQLHCIFVYGNEAVYTSFTNEA